MNRFYYKIFKNVYLLTQRVFKIQLAGKPMPNQILIAFKQKTMVSVDDRTLTVDKTNTPNLTQSIQKQKPACKQTTNNYDEFRTGNRDPDE